MKRKILLTGAAGRIGTFFRQTYADRYDFILTDQREPQETDGFPFTQADLSDFDIIRTLCDGVDTVVHLGADPRMDAPWESLLPSNVIGLYNVFESARLAGCRRVVFASSINAVWGYPSELQLRTDEPVNPANLYGATKCWGEAVARVYANAHNLSGLCLRFGAVQPRNSEIISPAHEWLDIVLTLEDCVRLIAAAVDAPDDLKFGIFNGVSNNRYKRMDLSDTRARLGYDPQDDSFVLAETKKNE
ncbi:MAG: NAD(P)-dependent oxidoreductase [Caldilineaceae bacterium]|nr:NAD(P)-dependent oxidoreductase [Caldilineaceae bacterium]